MDLNLALLADAHMEAGVGDADRTGLERRAGRVERAGGGGFGQAIALVDRNVRTAEERQQLRVQRGASGHDPLGAAAEHLAQLRVDHRVEGGAAGGGQGLGLAVGADLLHVVLRGDHAGGERHALDAVAGLLRGGVVYLLQHTGHHDHDGGLGLLQIVDQRGDALRDVDAQVAGDDDVVDGAGESMRLRQEQQHGTVPVVQHGRHERLQRHGGGAVMLVGHLHALGRGGGTGGVHDRAQVGLLHRIDARIQLLVGDLVRVRLDLGQAAGLQAQDALQRRAFRDCAVGLVAHLDGFHDEQPSVGVVHDVADLLGRIGLVDRGHHAAARHDRRVDDVPLIGGAAHERHGVALAQAALHQALGGDADVLQHLGGRLGHPGVAGLVCVQRVITHAFGALRVQVVDRHVLIQRGNALGVGGEQACLLIDVCGRRTVLAPGVRMRQTGDIQLPGTGGGGIVGTFAGVVADRVDEVAAELQCLLRQRSGGVLE